MHVSSRLAKIAILLFSASCATPNSGITTEDLDYSVNPSENFYQHANGSWLKRNTLPEGSSRHIKHFEVQKGISEKIRTMVQSGDVDPQIKKLYASALDLDEIEKKGFARPDQAMEDHGGKSRDLPVIVVEGDARTADVARAFEDSLAVTRFRLDEEADKATIAHDFNWLCERVQPNDTVMIYFCGHAGHFGEGQRAKNYLMPHNAHPADIEGTATQNLGASMSASCGCYLKSRRVWVS